MGPVLGPFKLHSIGSKGNVNPMSVDLDNTDCVGPVLCPCKLFPISPEAVNPDMAFRMPLVENVTGEVEVCWNSEPVVYIPVQSDVDWESLSGQQFIIQLHEAVIASGVPNFVGCTVSLKTKLNK